MATIHNRMPVILDRVATWLAPTAGVDEVRALLHPRTADGMKALPVEEAAAE